MAKRSALPDAHTRRTQNRPESHPRLRAGYRLTLCAACGGGEAVGISPSTRALTLVLPGGEGMKSGGEGEYCTHQDRRRALILFDSKYAQRTDLILVVVAEPLALADLNLPESHWA